MNNARSAVPAVALEGVSKSFGTTQALIEVTLRVRNGEVVALIGPSGSGKSTLLRCINWLEVPDSGEVRVAGVEVGVSTSRDGARRPLSETAIARQRALTGMVFQHFNLFPHLSVRENVALAPVRVFGVPKAQAFADADQLLERVGLSAKQDSFPMHLSGGQKQRVAIARSLAVKPEVLLFDEPTSALDPEMVGEVLDVMREVALTGTTMIVVTHEMSFARECADRVVMMDHGQVVEESPPTGFFAQPKTDRARRFLESLR